MELMNLLDVLIEKSAPVDALAAAVSACAEQLKLLAQNVAILAHNQQVHSQMILQIHQTLAGKAMDVSFPKIVRPDVKPN